MIRNFPLQEKGLLGLGPAWEYRQQTSRTWSYDLGHAYDNHVLLSGDIKATPQALRKKIRSKVAKKHQGGNCELLTPRMLWGKPDNIPSSRVHFDFLKDWMSKIWTLYNYKSFWQSNKVQCNSDIYFTFTEKMKKQECQKHKNMPL